MLKGLKSKDINKDLNDLTPKPKVQNIEETQVEKDFVKKDENADDSNDAEVENSFVLNNDKAASTKTQNHKNTDDTELEMEVETATEDEVEVDEKSAKIVEDFGEFDPTLELKNFKFPTLDLLKDYNQGNTITIDQKELEKNKNKIVETLNNYKIGIAQIKATVGPTVTLYEIIPEAGIRISKIKNLEDDIALSLSALGIRIIAPIPGKERLV